MIFLCGAKQFSPRRRHHNGSVDLVLLVLVFDSENIFSSYLFALNNQDLLLS